MNSPRQGDLWWGESPEREGRPYLVMTRDEAIPVLRNIVVATVTRTVRGIASELPLGRDEGLMAECAVSLDNLVTVPKSMLTRRLGRLGGERSGELCAAVASAFDC